MTLLLALLIAAAPNPCALGDGVIDIRTFGAVANDNVDDSAAIAAALACGRPIFVPPGVFIADHLTLPDNASIRGAGRYSSTLRVSRNGPCLAVRGTPEKGIYHFEIADLGLDGRGIGTVGIDLSYAREGTVRDCYIHDFRVGLKADQAWTNRIRATALVHNAESNVILGPNSNDVTLDDCQLDAGGDHGLEILGGSSGIRVSNCVVQGAGFAGITVGAAKAVTIIGVYLERNGVRGEGAVPHIDALGTRGLTIIGSVFWGVQAAAAVRLENVSGAAMMGNVVSDSGAPSVSVDIGSGSRNVAIMGNSFSAKIVDRSPAGAVRTTP
jgi:hypothetical protein